MRSWEKQVDALTVWVSHPKMSAIHTNESKTKVYIKCYQHMQQYLKAMHSHTPSLGVYKDIVRNY